MTTLQHASRRRKLVGGGVGTVIVVALVVALARGGAEPAPPPVTQAARPAPEAARIDRRAPTAVDRRLSASFPLLRAPARPLPPELRADVAPELELVPSLARPVPAILLGGRLWIVPGRGGLCLVVQAATPGFACSSTEEALAHGGVDITSVQPATAPGTTAARSVVGIAREGAVRATIRTERAQTSVPVIDGVYVLRDRVEDAPTDIQIR